MDRRDFLQAAALALPAASLFPATSRAQSAGTASAGWRIFETTTRVEVQKPAGTTRVWLPLPLADDTDYQKSLGNTWDAGAGKAGFVRDAKYGAGIVSAEFPEGVAPVLTLTSRFAARDRSLDLARAGNPQPLSKAEFALYTEATELLPTDGVVRDTAREITKGARGEVEKARAIYEWIVENTFRDPKTRGCGVGDIRFMLESRNLSGKCADLNALFVGLARSVGVAARDGYGVRVADSARGFKSLGKAGDITKAQHCRAEFWSPAHGWVPVDPADVRKVVLEEKPGLTLADDAPSRARQMLFGNWEMNWLAYNYAHDLTLPGGKGKVGFFMYPCGETAEGKLDSLDPATFRYTIGSREIVLA